ncbi:hypothetical protein KSB_90700 [Ktedonobacter robiniae]|uniref:Uncharacterized protein n=1 Tax=Ktedonobacter robiniae TaxID=2778365 RepID=A0ABQ3V873_9CHLR|nr:hypothetical protein KSB_84620 [Ktedonobacter robiniae]GHO60595.1 hypothetical protein KSB_90700 [Ktedonobacter robiniae]
MTTERLLGDKGNVMVVLLTPQLCGCESGELKVSDARTAGDEPGALMFPDDAKVRSILSNLLARTIGNGKGMFLVVKHEWIILEKIDVGSLEQAEIVNHAACRFLTRNAPSNGGVAVT